MKLSHITLGSEVCLFILSIFTFSNINIEYVIIFIRNYKSERKNGEILWESRNINQLHIN